MNQIPVNVSAKFKSATARATIRPGSGEIRINSQPLKMPWLLVRMTSA